MIPLLSESLLVQPTKNTTNEIIKIEVLILIMNCGSFQVLS